RDRFRAARARPAQSARAESHARAHRELTARRPARGACGAGARGRRPSADGEERGMSRKEKSSRDLEQEIERTRERVERELRALEERLHPSHLLEQLRERLRDGGGREFVQNLGRSVRDNPLAVALTGLGIAWLAVSRSGSGPRGAAWQSDGEGL